ncbi:MAG: dihydrodipicolinate synthase family protein [Oscillibacter sp.]|nr:dihydrodipicolinate synthase family protein [Oscillibacter sp.]
MLREQFPRLWFPPLTYYRADGSLDFARMDAMLARVYPHCQGVLIPGSTGDGWILPEKDQEAIVRHFLAGFSFGRFRMLLGALKGDTAQTISAIRRWCEILRETSGLTDDAAAMAALGVEGFVICVPNGMTDSAAQEAALGEVLELGLPTAFYQLPQITGALVAPEVVSRLADYFSNLILGKDSGGGDEMAQSGLLKDKLMLLRGAEGDPTALLNAGCYDGLLLSTVNSFPAEYDALLQGTGTFGAFGEVISLLFDAAAKAPISNAFSDANRAIDHAMYYGSNTLQAPAPLCIGGKPLPMALVQLAVDALSSRDLLPAKGYGK